MERPNYFELLGLEFDPPEKNEKKIQKAIAVWKKSMEDALANETIEERRNDISAKLALHDDIVQTLKDVKTRNPEARALKEKRTSQLEKLIEIMVIGQTGTPEVTNAQIRNVHLKLKLSPKTIEDTYVKNGFEVQKRQKAINLNDAFLSPVIFNTINGYVEQLQKTSIPKFPWTSKVTSLFDLAYYWKGDASGDPAGFRRKRTTELYSIMEPAAQQFSSDMSPIGHLLADLFTAGTTQVFDSETNRKKYEMSLELMKMKEFFALLKSAPDEFKKDRYFAESCIKNIQKSFPDYNLALALYNREAGLVQDPYEPLEALIHVTCGVCKTAAEFRTREDAQKGKCAVCGAELYMTCPKCGKKVPTAAEWCGCGFHISEVQFFNEYCNAAEFALKEMDLAEARRQLANAQNAYPGHPKLAALSKKIEDENAKYQKPLNELDAMIKAGNFYAAKKRMEALSASMPQLRLETQRKIINDKIAQAQKMMPQGNLSPADKANRCVEILESVKDYQPAIEMLGTCRPGSPKNLHGVIGNTMPLTCTLTWNAPGDKGVTYCVVRKKNGVPRQYSDGEMLATDVNILEYRDKTVQPGIHYGYAVFAYRRGVYSDPVTCEVERFSELDESRLRAEADNGVCRFSWVLPANCIGVRILRCTNGTPVENGRGVSVVAERASANFDDTTVTNDVSYGYRLQCVYPYGDGFRYSEGHTVMLRPEQPPLPLRNVTAKADGRLVRITWTAPDTAQRSVIVREVSSKSVSNMIGQVVPATDINSILGSGRTYANATSSAQQCQFDIPQNVSLALAVVIISGSKGIISEVVRVSSVEKCEINKKETCIDGGRLKIVLQQIPKNVERIHYIVAQKVDSKVPWATPEDAKRNTLQVITVADYYKDGMILIEMPPKDDLYISVIGQYRMPDGSVVYADTSKQRISNRPKKSIKYRLSWGSGGLFSSKPKPKDCKLYITTDAEETPVMKLVYRADGHIPMRLLDPKTIVLHTVEETETGFPGGQYVFSFPDGTWEKLKPQTELRLMMAEDAMVEYELAPENIALLKVPQK